MYVVYLKPAVIRSTTKLKKSSNEDFYELSLFLLGPSVLIRDNINGMAINFPLITIDLKDTINVS